MKNQKPESFPFHDALTAWIESNYELTWSELVTRFAPDLKDQKERNKLRHALANRSKGKIWLKQRTEKAQNPPKAVPETKENEESVINDLKTRQLGAEAKLWKKKYDKALLEIESLSNTLDDVSLIKEPVIVSPFSLHEASLTLGTAAPILQFSDWHVEEKVVASTIDGLNEFNPDICRKRVFMLAQNSLKCINNARQNSVIKEVVLILGGDFVNNFLHEHDTRNNYMSPIEAVRFAKELLINSISFILEYGKLEKLTIACTRGNHSRQTKKMSASDDFRMNYEHMLYLDLKDYFDQRTSLIEWHVPTGTRGYLEVYGKTIRYLHGWEVKGAGGIGGITIPLNKIISRYDSIRSADYTFMHDKHVYFNAAVGCQINGSLVGYNAYARMCGFPFQVPMQAFTLLDKKRGFTIRQPIFCE
jgi:hypothetical protein